jgi:hypothetical protein
MEETLARHEERSRLSPVVRTRVLAHLFSWPRATRGLAAAALVAVLSLAFWRLTSTGSGEGPGDGGRGTDPGTTILSRGQDDALPPVAVGISGVDDEGREYEAVDGDGVCLEHALKFYLALREPAFDHYAILGLQDGVPLWYIPEPGENRDYVVPRDVELPYMLPWEVALAPRHHAGQALVVAVLSRSRVNPSDVEAALPKAASAGTSSGEVEALLARALGPRYRVSAVAYTVRSCEVER